MTIIRYWCGSFKSASHAEKFCLIFKLWIARGWSCHLVLSEHSEGNLWNDCISEAGVQIHFRRRPIKKFDLTFIQDVNRLCRHLKPDVLLAENLHDGVMIGAAVARVPVRIWIKRAMNSCFEKGDKIGVKDKLAISTRLSTSLATRTLAVSGAVRDELVNLGMSSAKIHVLPNPVFDQGGLENVDRSVVRGRCGLKETDVVWTSVGHAIPVKGWDMLIRAFAPVARADSRVRLLLVGSLDGPSEVDCASELRALVQSLGVEDQVIMRGRANNVPEILAISDGYVMSSRSEGFCNALVEAFQAKLPCVATRVGIAGDLIQSGINGILVDRFDEQAMHDALLQLTQDDAERRAMAAKVTIPDSLGDLGWYASTLADQFEELLPA